MDLHKPKAVRNWRELLSEIGIIVLGVLIALGAEQAVEWVHWQHKIDAAKESMNLEIKNSLLAVDEANKLQACQARQLDAAQAAIVKGDWPGAVAVLGKGSIESFRFWGEDAFAATIAGQVSDHFGTRTMSSYASVYTMIRKNRQHQEDVWATAPTLAMLAIPDLPTTPDVRLKELEALTRVRNGLAEIVSQGQALSQLARDDLGLSVTEADFRAAPGRVDMVAKCNAAAAALGQPAH